MFERALQSFVFRQVDVVRDFFAIIDVHCRSFNSNRRQIIAGRVRLVPN